MNESGRIVNELIFTIREDRGEFHVTAENYDPGDASFIGVLVYLLESWLNKRVGNRRFTIEPEKSE